MGDLISAQSEYALKSSISQLKGSMKEKMSSIRSKIIHHTAFIESALDDPEHVILDGYGEELGAVVEGLIEDIEKLLSTCDSGKMIKEGIQTVIVGKPNVGKSSLLNALLEEDRAIVTEVAGTTRDILEEHVNLHGISLNLMDTAGIRDADDIVEKIGVDRAKSYAGAADLILCVVDASNPLDENDREIFRMICGKRFIILLNKTDLENVVKKRDIQEELYIIEEETGGRRCFYEKKENIENEKRSPFMSEGIEISAKNRQGMEELEDAIKDMFFRGGLSFNDEVYITNVRHKDALNQAHDSLCKVKESIENGMPEDFYSIDLIDAYESLGKITGETIGEDLVNEIFSRFCMGK